MAGEMYFINQDGTDSDGEIWQTHADIAKAINGRLEPFDKYQGPYIVVGKDLRMGATPYSVPVRHLGIVRLWLVPAEDQPDDFTQIYREDTNKLSEPFLWCDSSMAISEAKRLLKS